jgi:hypothetical protein
MELVNRVPIIRPNNGVKPMDVSILLFPETAVTLAPFPKWQTISWKLLLSVLRVSGEAVDANSSVAFSETYHTEVP